MNNIYVKEIHFSDLFTSRKTQNLAHTLSTFQQNQKTYRNESIA